MSLNHMLNDQLYNEIIHEPMISLKSYLVWNKQTWVLIEKTILNLKKTTKELLESQRRHFINLDKFRRHFINLDIIKRHLISIDIILRDILLV